MARACGGRKTQQRQDRHDGTALHESESPYVIKRVGDVNVVTENTGHSPDSAWNTQSRRVLAQAL